jgi:thiol-disulfide isomerase/thioredoxin
MSMPALIQQFTKTLATLTLIATAQNALALEVGSEAPRFGLPGLRAQDGTTVDLKSYRGKVVYVDFWASWCAPCVISTPLLNKLRHELVQDGQSFEIVAVNVDKDPEDGIDFLLDEPVEYVAVSDPNGNTPTAYEVKAMPTAFLLDKTGKIRFIHQGFKASDIDVIKAEAQKLLTE